MRTARYMTLLILVLAGITSAQVWSDWTATDTNPELEYRSQISSNMRNCHLEFRDKRLGKGNTTFDVSIDYRSTTQDANGDLIMKNDTEHIVITPTSVGTARIPECLGISQVRVSFLQRQ